jgi:hypothetical protein
MVWCPNATEKCPPRCYSTRSDSRSEGKEERWNRNPNTKTRWSITLQSTGDGEKSKREVRRTRYGGGGGGDKLTMTMSQIRRRWRGLARRGARGAGHRRGGGRWWCTGEEATRRAPAWRRLQSEGHRRRGGGRTRERRRRDASSVFFSTARVGIFLAHVFWRVFSSHPRQHPFSQMQVGTNRGSSPRRWIRPTTHVVWGPIHANTRASKRGLMLLWLHSACNLVYVFVLH